MNGLRLAAQRLDQLLAPALEASVCQRRQPDGVGFLRCQRMEDAAATYAKQIADHAGQLNAHLFQQALQLIAPPRPVLSKLDLHARESAQSRCSGGRTRLKVGSSKKCLTSRRAFSKSRKRPRRALFSSPGEYLRDEEYQNADPGSQRADRPEHHVPKPKL